MNVPSLEAGSTYEIDWLADDHGIVYSTIGVDTDGYPIDVAYSPVLKPGVYHAAVTPVASTTLSQTYSLDFSAGSTTINLAHDLPLSQIPVNGYGVIVKSDNSIVVDTTAPEAIISFSTSTKEIVINGIDAESTTTQKTTLLYKQVCTKQKKNVCIEYKQIPTDDLTVITDAAGNTLSLLTDPKSDIARAKNTMHLTALVYATSTVGATTTTSVSMRYSLNTDRREGESCNLFYT
jgi:hypothetical protein